MIGNKRYNRLVSKLKSDRSDLRVLGILWRVEGSWSKQWWICWL